MLFSIGNKLEVIKENPFRLEREIQNLTEENLETIFGLQLIKSEFTIKNFRIDTLAFDPENNAFVIIEYKRGKTFSVVDQGYTYLSLMLNNKADFILEFNENNSNNLKRQGVDWSQSKVLFVSPKFTSYQQEAINFKDLPIELWEVKRFENNTVSFKQIQKSGSQESIKTISKQDANIDAIANEIVVYSEEQHLANAGDEIKNLYEDLKNAILDFGDLTIKPKKKTIGINQGKHIIVDLLPQKKQLKITLNLKKGQLDDPKNLTRDMSSIGHAGNGDYEITINNDENLEYILSLVKQILNR